MEIHLLDVGLTKYGDCIVATHDGQNIFIDAGHEGDLDRISAQLKKVFDHAPPFHFDLIVVTHAHSDHIGCMPRLVSDGVITCDAALVADERLGFGRDASDVSPVDSITSPAVRKLAVALQEEPADDLDDAALAQFIEDAATLESKYKDMLTALQENDTKIVRYGTNPAASVAAIERSLAGFGFKVLGPTPKHLALCAMTISDSVTDASDSLQSGPAIADDSASLVTMYRQAVADLARKGQVLSPDAAVEDRPGVGAAKNDQSIVIRLQADGWRALLPGDMQFAEPEVTDLDPEMRKLRDVIIADIVAEGAFDFVKLPHHASYNGLDESVLNEWGDVHLFGHTGGVKDPSHPDAGVLKLLKDRSDSLSFARTDRNGLITVKKVRGKPTFIPERGELNNFRKNPATTPRRDESSEVETPPTEITPASSINVESPSGTSGVVEVIARVPHVDTTVTVTIQVNPGQKKTLEPEVVPVNPRSLPTDRKLGAETRVSPMPSTSVRLGGGRTINESLLFVTRRDQLNRNIGLNEATAALKAIKDAGKTLLELPASADTVDQAIKLVRAELSERTYDGVVLVGGYDVVQSARLDVLDAKLRATLDGLGLTGRDSDRFIVWSDALYGDIDGDSVAELPVSRIPDGRRSDVLLHAIQASAPKRTVRFGVRNSARAFADAVYKPISGNIDLVAQRSGPFTPELLRPQMNLTGDVYFMLHGSDNDATRYWGEDAGGLVEAVDLQSVPDRASGAIVFTGCCWGALTVTPAAAKLRPGVALRPRGPESSIAIAFLQAGALAFVGCTGTHYSPVKPTAPWGLDFFGKPMHDEFWANINRGLFPARALFEAKKKYASQLPHGPDDPFSRAVEMKILREYTLLGLGW
ncbi:MBL fold metallo-hydrolase [Planctomyces sp. SH-PL14]|uniref:MBL fold metallo-hydrolase n=1 Tax=Planctomyces sp. SH-PL14 TaxID=1632864 RepID=UPI00078E6654|nr:MBL fold metallo-hydrolase [Planctomyces sp. SH-PL14]AMV18395.1 hypothetical protein VT03_10925 [Planctomyces sp. SH-PL14]